MPFDGGFTRNTVNELKRAIDCHIDKIYQPSRDELVFLLRKKGFAARLLICSRPGGARIQFTETKLENPAVAPMFCMLARKHFSGARLISVNQNSLERVIELEFEATDEMGDRVKPRVVCELIGNQSNIILVDDKGKTIDAVRRSDIETAKRLIHPGAAYTYPEPQGKLDITECTLESVYEEILRSDCALSKALISTFDGLSPLICREIAYRAYGDDIEACTAKDSSALLRALNEIKHDIIDGKPTLLCDENGAPADFSYTDIGQYGERYQRIEYNSFGELLDAFYSKRELHARMQRAAGDILKLVNNALSRAIKRLALRREELRGCADRERFRIYGELIKANLYAIENGSRRAVVQNYYDPELSEIEIPLDPALTPANNAAKYFKEYKKSYTAEQTLTALTAQDEKEIEYLESVLDALSRSESMAELAEIREELAESGYLPQKNEQKKKKTVSSPIKEYTSKEGYRILVGKNNRQNDEITTRIAAKNDLWFHVKNIAGSHVLVCCGGEAVSDETVLFAARLAAFHSKASASSQVPVDYTRVKFVKKPNGAKAGMVIYTTNQTVYVTPSES